MNDKVAVDTAQLRANAESLSGVSAERTRATISGSSFGARVSRHARDQFEDYWHPALSTLTNNIDTMVKALRSAADVYERRDGTSAQVFDPDHFHGF